MTFLDNASEGVQNVTGKGVSSSCEAMSGVALESFGFVRDFVRMCDDGWQQGWHERNGGNASYRLTADEIESAQSFFDRNLGGWVALDVQEKALAKAYFLVTAAGSYMRNVSDDPRHTVGIVEINDAGDAYRVCWGLLDGGKPTSEFAGHFLIHAARMKATDGTARVLYHAHPVSIIALSKVLPLDAHTFTRVLWKAMTECIMVFPEGIGVVDFEVPGSLELAKESASRMEHTSAVVWAHHGLLCSGDTFDDTFGRMHAIVKAAEIEVQARLLANTHAGFGNASGERGANSATGGDAGISVNRMTDGQLRAIAQSLNLKINEEFLS